MGGKGSGRHTRPTRLKILQGNPGKRALPKDEPQPAMVSESHPPPDWLHDDGKTEWRRLAPILSRNGMLTEVDIDALATYCHAWVTWKHAITQVRREGFIVKSRNGYPMQSAWTAVANKAFAQLKVLMEHFGMTPSSRTKVQAPGAAGGDAFAEFDQPPASRKAAKR